MPMSVNRAWCSLSAEEWTWLNIPIPAFRDFL